jgi:TolB-like protein/Flp pilus assembly protein TadD
MPEPNSVPAPPDSAAKERLESWKEIAAYLNRDVRTVQRWEKNEGLPIHRHQHDKLASVFALRSEINIWLNQRLIPQADAIETEAGDSSLSGQVQVRNWMWPSVIALCVLIAIVIASYLIRTHLRNTSHPNKVMLGVLPFKNLGGSADQYFADGLTEEMIASLGRVHPEKLGVVVLGKSGSPESFLDKFSKQRRLDYILEGSVRHADNRVRITVDLVQTQDQTRVWGDSYERSLKDILAIQSEVATSIASAIAIQLPASRPVQQVNPEAYEAYLKGRYFWNKRTPESLNKAIEYFILATQKDPNYASAYSGIADCYALLSSLPYSVLPPWEGFPKAKAAAERALALDDGAPEAHVSMSYIHLVYDWDLPGARREIKRALELNPESPTAHQYYGYVLAAEGKLNDALEERRKAEALDPLSPVIVSAVGEAYYQNRQYEESIEQNKKVLELDPTFLIGTMNHARSLVQLGRYGEAQQDLSTALAAAPDYPALLACQGYAYARAGNRLGAETVLAKLTKLRRHQFVPAIYIAAVYTGLPNKDAAFQWLNEALKEHSEYLAYIQSDPMADTIRDDPRFATLLREIGVSRGSYDFSTSK